MLFDLPSQKGSNHTSQNKNASRYQEAFVKYQRRRYLLLSLPSSCCNLSLIEAKVPRSPKVAFSTLV